MRKLIMQYTLKTNVDEDGGLINEFAFKSMDVTTDNREELNKLISKEEQVFSVWEKEDYEEVEKSIKHKKNKVIEAEIIKGLGAKDKTDAIVKQLNILMLDAVKKNGASKELKATVKVVADALSEK